MSNSFVRVPPDGAGKKIHTTQHTIDANIVEVQHIHISDLSNPMNTLEIDNKGSGHVRFAEGDPILDSYNNLKVGQEQIIGVYEHSVDAYDDLFYTLLVSGGTYNYNQTTSSISLLTTSSPNSKSERTTNRYHYYQPSTSMVTLIGAACGDSGKANNVRKWGVFDDNNGLYFELDGTKLGVVQRSNITGVVIDTEYYREDLQWNGDPLDGTGLSGINIDVTQSYTYFISFNWPSGSVRFGIHDPIRGRVTCHTINNSGVLSVPTIQSASLPIRFSNENRGVASSGSELKEIFATICAETNPHYTYWRFGDLGCYNKIVTTNTPILSLRPKLLLDNGNHNHINSYPETLSVYSSGNTLRIGLVWCSSDILSGTTWSMNSIDGPLEADSGATSIDINHSSYWLWKTWFVEKDIPFNIDLTPFFELNDEAVLLSGNGINDNILTVVGNTFNGNPALVSVNISYKGLY